MSGEGMGNNVKINITISEELDKKFREVVAQTYGFRKGNLKIAIEEALEMWIEQEATKSEERNDRNR